MKTPSPHILILSSWYPSDNHPFLGNFVQRQAQLLGTKYKVTVIHTVAKASGEIECSTNTSLGFDEIQVHYNGGGHILSRKKQERRALKTALKQLQPVDLLIGNVLLPRGWQFLIAKKMLRCPFIYVEHGSYFRENSPFKWSRFQLVIKRKVAKQASAIVAVSDFLKRDLATAYPNNEIGVIGNHIDATIFDVEPKVSQDTTQFLHVSTLDPNTKNPQGIIDACELLKQKTADFKLTIISDEDTTDWQAYVSERQLNHQITFVGPLQWEALVPYYHQADAFVLFSEYETFSIVLAEAWSTGTPVISTPVGIAVNLSPELGISIEINNPPALAEAMEQFIDKKNTFNAAAIRSEAMNYSSEHILQLWSQHIERYVK